jgi:hypothetical protein
LRLGAVPENVHLALAPQVLTFSEQGFTVLPAPLTQRQTHDDLTAWFDTAETTPGFLRLGLAHGSVQGLLVPLCHKSWHYARELTRGLNNHGEVVGL